MDNRTITLGIGLLIVTIMFTVVPYVGDQLSSTVQHTERIQTINVFFDDEGTTATVFKVAMYDESGRLRKVTESGDILGDSWCQASFSVPVTINEGEKYSLLVSANGEFSIPGDSENGYISEALAGYGAFPGTITPISTNDLSIYAEYL